jgi:hypothetical protein
VQELPVPQVLLVQVLLVQELLVQELLALALLVQELPVQAACSVTYLHHCLQVVSKPLLVCCNRRQTALLLKQALPASTLLRSRRCKALSSDQSARQRALARRSSSTTQ